MNTIDYKNFYAEVGKLLYAVADVDNMVAPAEKEAIYRMIRNELAPAEKHTDEFGTDAAYYAEAAFDYMDEAIVDSETALQSFIDYVREHRRLLTLPMRQACLNLAERLAEAYHGKNKKEKALISILKAELLVQPRH